MASVTLSHGISEIGIYAFCKCENLTSVTIPNSVTSIGKYAFRNCSKLVSVTIPNSITSIGEFTFSLCVELVDVVIPNSITTIDAGLFSGCSKLESVTIPSSVTEVKSSAFKECTSLTKIYNYGINPANAYSNVFDGVNKSSCTLYVPKNSINLYKNAPVWKEFYLISAIEDVQAIEDAEIDNVRSAKVIIDGKVYINRGDKTYTLQGQEVK